MNPGNAPCGTASWRRGRRALALAAALLWPGVAAAQCVVLVAAPRTEPERPDHHPVGRGLPSGPDFRQPDGCTSEFWFFDDDRDGSADPAEARLFGPDRQVVCASCHNAIPAQDSIVATETYLRQDPKTLCLSCHAL
ncbi:MAG: hypothetical protein KDG52_07875 [Rhodocyclaceae bacterium]|nr:hypothetical protein [Rhodocyclaceae bacterium]